MTDAGTQPRRDVLISLAVMMATLALLEGGYRASKLHARLQAEDHFTKRLDDFRALERDPEVVFIGNSRVQFGLDTEVIEGLLSEATGREVLVWNFGMGGAIAQPQLAFALRTLDRPRPPKAVVLFTTWTNFQIYGSQGLKRKVLVKLWELEDVPSVIRAGASAEETATVALNAALRSMSHRSRLLEILFRHRSPNRPANTGRRGFSALEPVSAVKQRSRAISRAKGYRGELRRGPMGLSAFKLGCLREAVRRLDQAGVKVLIVNSPTSSPIRALAQVPGMPEPEYLTFARSVAEEYSAEFLDHQSPPILTDPDFADGDHLNELGARRYSTWLTREVLLPEVYGLEPEGADRWTRPEPSKGCQVLFDFEELELEGWRLSGKAFAEPLASGARARQGKVTGSRGLGLLSSYHRTEGFRAEGAAESPPFVLERPRLKLLVGGGREGVGVELVVDGRVERRAAGRNDEALRPVTWDVSPFRGQEARVRVVDGSSARWGHLMIDQVEECR